MTYCSRAAKHGPCRAEDCRKKIFLTWLYRHSSGNANGSWISRSSCAEYAVAINFGAFADSARCLFEDRDGKVKMKQAAWRGCRERGMQVGFSRNARNPVLSLSQTQETSLAEVSVAVIS